MGSVHPAFYAVGTGVSFLDGRSSRGQKLFTNLYILPRLGINGAVRPRHLSFSVHRDNCAFNLRGWGIKRPRLALPTYLRLMPSWDINLCDFCTPTSRWVLFQLRGIRDIYLQTLDTVVTGEWYRHVAGDRWLPLQRSVRSLFVELSNTDDSWMRLEFSVRIAVMDRPEGGGWRLLWKFSSYQATWCVFGRLVS